MSKVFINNIGTYNDNRRNLTINGNPANVSEIVNSFFHGRQPEDIQAEEVTPTVATEHFKHITQKCINQGRAETVEAEIRAACKGTAEGVWRTLWNNEHLGYVVVQPIDATKLYRDLENHYGTLPFKERQFRAARNKR